MCDKESIRKAEFSMYGLNTRNLNDFSCLVVVSGLIVDSSNQTYYSNLSVRFNLYTNLYGFLVKSKRLKRGVSSD